MKQRRSRSFLRPQTRPQFLALLLCLLLVVLALAAQQPPKPDIFSEIPSTRHKVQAQQSLVIPPMMPWKGSIQPVPRPAGPTPVYGKIDTVEPVIFLGIDDGITKSPEAQKWLVQNRLPFSLFLDNDAIKDNYGYFSDLQTAGMTIENHTLSHPHLTKLKYDQQKAEICGASDTYANVFGRRPVLFRPPYGEFNDATRQAVADCGMKAIVMWRALVGSGTEQYQDDRTHFEPGDIVLMHFTPSFIQDMQAFAAEVNNHSASNSACKRFLGNIASVFHQLVINPGTSSNGY